VKTGGLIVGLADIPASACSPRIIKSLRETFLFLQIIVILSGEKPYSDYEKMHTVKKE
jgi:hypothetical protein